MDLGGEGAKIFLTGYWGIAYRKWEAGWRPKIEVSTKVAPVLSFALPSELYSPRM